MKTIPQTQLWGSQLVMVLAMLLVSFAMQGQTYRILKASNDPGAYADRDEVSSVLSADEMTLFNQLRSTSNVVGYMYGQEYNLAQAEGFCQRAQTYIPYFSGKGLAWMNENAGLQMVVLVISDVNDLASMSSAIDVLIQTHNVRYLVIQTMPELYPNADLSTYSDVGLSIVVPAVSSYLNSLYDVGIRTFFTAVDPK